MCDIDDAGNETAFVFAEVYRRSGTWKIRTVAQGWDSGLAGLAQDFGVSVSDEPDEDEPDEETGHRPAPPSSPAVEGEGADGTTDRTESAAIPPQAPGDDLVEVVDEVDRVVSGLEAEPSQVPPAAPGEEEVAGLRLPEVSAPVVATVTVRVGEDRQPSIAVETPAPVVGTVPRRPQPSRKGVQTRKVATVAARPPALRLAGADTWQPARVFSIYGVGSAGEQEKRATSAVLATMMGVRSFARAVVSHFGAPGGAVEAYLEVPFDLGETRVYPDGVLRVARAGKTWTGLVEVKTGDGQLRRDQVENYLDVARAQGFDAVITLSNDIPQPRANTRSRSTSANCARSPCTTSPGPKCCTRRRWH